MPYKDPSKFFMIRIHRDFEKPIKILADSLGFTRRKCLELAINECIKKYIK